MELMQKEMRSHSLIDSEGLEWSGIHIAPSRNLEEESKERWKKGLEAAKLSKFLDFIKTGVVLDKLGIGGVSQKLF